MYCVVIVLFESHHQDDLGLILQTDSASNDGMSSYEDKYLNLALGVVSGVFKASILIIFRHSISMFCLCHGGQYNLQTADCRPSTKCRIGINCTLKLQTWYKMQTVKKTYKTALYARFQNYAPYQNII
jgi:hypothetical protein